MVYLMILLGTICGILIIIFPTLFVGFPKMAQKTVNRADLDLFEFRIDNVTPDSFDLNAQVFVTGVGQSAVLNPTTFRLAPEHAVLPEIIRESKKKRHFVDGYIPRFLPHHLRGSYAKRNHISGHVVPGLQDSSSSALGYLKVENRTRVGKGVEQPLLMVGSHNGRLMVDDTHVWSEIFEHLVFEEEGYRAKLDGTAQIRYGGLKATTMVSSKPFVFPGRFISSHHRRRLLTGVQVWVVFSWRWELFHLLSTVAQISRRRWKSRGSRRPF